MIKVVGALCAAGATLTIPAHLPGDIIIGFAFRDDSTTNPTVGTAGWTTLTTTTDGTSCSLSMAWKLATTAAESFGSWTKASDVAVIVLRGCSSIATPIGTFQAGAGVSTTVTYPAVTMTYKGGTSVVVAFGAHRSTDVTLETPPTGMQFLAGVSSTAELAVHITSPAQRGNWPATAVSVGGTSSGWQAVCIEVYAMQNEFDNFSNFGDKPIS